MTEKIGEWTDHQGTKTRKTQKTEVAYRMPLKQAAREKRVRRLKNAVVGKGYTGDVTAGWWWFQIPFALLLICFSAVSTKRVLDKPRTRSCQRRSFQQSTARLLFEKNRIKKSGHHPGYIPCKLCCLLLQHTSPIDQTLCQKNKFPHAKLYMAKPPTTHAFPLATGTPHPAVRTCREDSRLLL